MKLSSDARCNIHKQLPQNVAASNIINSRSLISTMKQEINNITISCVVSRNCRFYWGRGVYSSTLSHMFRDSFLAGPYANSLISVTIRGCTHTKVNSQTIIYPNPNQNQKKIKFGRQIPNPNTKVLDSRKGRLSAALVLGLEILDSSLYLTQCSIIKELD